MDLEFVRGDTQPIKFQIKDNDGNILKMEDGDELILTVKKNYNTSKISIQKKLSKGEIYYQEGYYITIFTHKDTAQLKYGTYVYDIQIQSGDMVATPLLGTITLTEEATHIINEQGGI